MLFAFADRSERNAGFDSHSLLTVRNICLIGTRRRTIWGAPIIYQTISRHALNILLMSFIIIPNSLFIQGENFISFINYVFLEDK